MAVAEEEEEERKEDGQEEEEEVGLKETFLRTVTEQEPPVNMRQMSDESALDVLVEMRSQSSDESMLVIEGRPPAGEGKAAEQENEDSNMGRAEQEEEEGMAKKGTCDGGDSSGRIGQSKTAMEG